MKGALLAPLFKALPACFAMAFVVNMILARIDWTVAGQVVSKSLVLALAVSSGVVVYLAGCSLFRIEEIRQGWDLLRKRKQSGQ